MFKIDHLQDFPQLAPAVRVLGQPQHRRVAPRCLVTLLAGIGLSP